MARLERLYCKQLTPCARKGSGHMRLDTLCTDTQVGPEFLDAFVHVHVQVITMHKWKIIMYIVMMVLVVCA